VLVPLLAGLAALQDARSPAVPLAGSVPAGELDFEVLDEEGRACPARLTFVASDGSLPELFTNVDAAPRELAARKHVVYTRSGRGRITVPAGRYAVYASRGLEWSLARTELELGPGERAAWQARLVHEVDTRGWVSGDFHLHTLTHSGHGDANLLERVLSFLGEGLEFAVATDHDHHTDYLPSVRELDALAQVTTVTGNEVSTPIGHFNAFPLDPARSPVDSSLTDANELFRLLRSEPNALGIVPLIQLNHPRWEGIDYFTQAGLDPVDGGAAQGRYSRDFDAIELLNENVGWGYFDPIADARDTGDNRHSVLVDWFHLLNRGERYAGVGNSDSHHVQQQFAGYPRNFVACSTDDPGRIDPAEVAAAVRAKRVFTTLGPFVDFAVEGVAMGGEARARDGHAELALRVQAASWVDCDRVKVIVNGDLAATLPVPEARTPLRLEQTLELCLLGRCKRHGKVDPAASPRARDAWVALLVEGDERLFPILNDQAQPALPLCVANPVWIDGDADGRWTSPAERIGAELARLPTPDEARLWFEALPPEEQVLALSAVPRGSLAGLLVVQALESPRRAVRLAAARACERCSVGGDSPVFQRAWAENEDDPYLAVLLLRALVAARGELGASALLALAQRHGDDVPRRYADELDSVLQAGLVTRWLALGHFEPSSSEARGSGGPPLAVDTTKTYAGRSGQSLAWRELEARPDGFLDLGALTQPGESAERAVAFAQVWLFTAQAKSVPACFGTDDGSRVWLNEDLIYDNPEHRRAHPLEKVAALDLVAGWNRLLFQVENATGSHGLFCRVLDPDVQVAPRRP